MPSEPTIYDYGFDKSLNRALNDSSTGVVYDTIQNALNTGSVLSGGSLNLKTLSIGSLVKQVAPGDDIQAAIDAVNREGGGTVQLLAKTYSLKYTINLKSNVNLVGAGRDLTILDFLTSTNGIKAVGPSTSDLVQNFSIKDLTIKNSEQGTGALNLKFADFFVIDNVRVTVCGTTLSLGGSGSQAGMYVNGCQNFRIVNCRSDNSNNNYVDGYLFTALSARDTSNFSLVNCTSDFNYAGFTFFHAFTSFDPTKFSVLNCVATENLNVGFRFVVSIVSNPTSLSSLIGCVANNNDNHGFDIGNSISDVQLISCSARGNGGGGISSLGKRVSITGCNANSNTSADYSFSTGTESCAFVGNLVTGTSTVASSTYYANWQNAPNDFKFVSFSNMGGSPKTEKMTMRMQNVSGGGLRIGNLVTLSTGEEKVTTTTTNGSNKVFGMALETIANNEYGTILTEGYTESLYVSNSSSSIVAGDWLSAYSHSYYAKKAIAGDMAFAMAVNSPTTSTASVKCILVSPRLI